MGSDESYHKRMESVRKFFRSLALAGGLGVLGAALVLAAPFFFVYLLVRQPMTSDEWKKTLDRLKDWADPDGDQDWRKEHRRQYGD